MTTSTGTGAAFSGDVTINSVVMVSSKNRAYDFTPYFVEINIHEDIFSPAMSGNAYIVDVNSLIEDMPIIGEEYLQIDFITPSLSSGVKKVFRVYKVEKREFSANTTSQTYVLHFSSSEAFIDSLYKVYSTFNGNTDALAQNIFTNYVQMPRTYDFTYDEYGTITDVVQSTENTTLISVTNSSNNVKFNSPGWGSLKCISWLASKTIGSAQGATDTLFFETNKNFYFASISEIIKSYKEAQTIAADYYLMPNNIISTTNSVTLNGITYASPDIDTQYKTVEAMSVLSNFDTLAMTRSGAYCSRQINVDIINKNYKVNDFDYVENFSKWSHLGDYPLFTNTQYRLPYSQVSIAYSHPGLFNGVKDNANELASQINQSRNSLLTGYANMFRLEISVPGRSDLEAGAVIYFQMPSSGAKTEDQSVTDGVNVDPYFSGLYVISSIRHKLTQTRYLQTLEIVKDSTQVNYQ